MADAECIASCEHDFEGGARLYAYRPVASDTVRGGEALAIRTFGIPVLSPETPYIAVWRSENSLTMNAESSPKNVFLTCAFGAEAWSPPTDLVQHAEQRNRRAEVVIRLNWECNGATPELDRFEAEIRAQGGEHSFRSINFGDNARALDIQWGALQLPGNGAQDIAFNCRVLLPERFNRGEPRGDRNVELTLTGSAVPIPRWVNY